MGLWACGLVGLKALQPFHSRGKKGWKCADRHDDHRNPGIYLSGERMSHLPRVPSEMGQMD